MVGKLVRVLGQLLSQLDQQNKLLHIQLHRLLQRMLHRLGRLLNPHNLGLGLLLDQQTTLKLLISHQRLLLLLMLQVGKLQVLRVLLHLKLNQLDQ